MTLGVMLFVKFFTKRSSFVLWLSNTRNYLQRIWCSFQKKKRIHQTKIQPSSRYHLCYRCQWSRTIWRKCCCISWSAGSDWSFRNTSMLYEAYLCRIQYLFLCLPVSRTCLMLLGWMKLYLYWNWTNRLKDLGIALEQHFSMQTRACTQAGCGCKAWWQEIKPSSRNK